MFKKIKNFMNDRCNYKYSCIDFVFRDSMVVIHFFLSYLSFLFGNAIIGLFCLAFGLICYHLCNFILFKIKKFENAYIYQQKKIRGK